MRHLCSAVFLLAAVAACQGNNFHSASTGRDTGHKDVQQPAEAGTRGDSRPCKATPTPHRRSRQAGDIGALSDVPVASHRGSGRHSGRRRGRPKGPRQNATIENFPANRPGGGDRVLFNGIFFGNPLLPHMVGDRVFVPMYKADNVTFQNVTGPPLKEGENVFLLPKGGKAPPRGKGRHHGFPRVEPYLKLFFNTTAVNKVSLEYGILKPVDETPIGW